MTDRLVFLGGSMRQGSLTEAALRAAADIARATGAKVELLTVRELRLPIYIPEIGVGDYPAEHQPSIQRLLEAARNARAMVWGSPTYHGTVGGAFKNALDFLEFLKHDPRPYLQGCAVGLISVAEPTTFASMVNSVHALRAWLVPTQVAVGDSNFGSDGSLDEATRTRMARLVDELQAFTSPRRRAA